MALLIGVLLALAVGIFATRIGLDRDRSFYPVVMLVIAFLYALFAVMGGSNQALVMELIAGVVFATLAVVGFKRSLWIVAAALVTHGLFDFFHSAYVANPGVPDFWPAFCGGYDVAAGGYLAWLLQSGRRAAVAPLRA